MTENPPVPSPPGLPQLLTNATSTPAPEEGGDSSGEIQCICDYTDDDGYTICCDKCERWQHVVCMQLPEDNPKQYLCSRCSPREIDVQRARELQRRRRRDEEHDRGMRQQLPPQQQVKRKRSGTTSHKKKESTSGSHTMPVSTKSAERNGSKAPSPRESHPPPSRKRGHRATQDGDRDADEEVEIEKYKFEFLDIENEPDNKYRNEEIKKFLKELVDSCNSGSDPTGRCKRYTTEDFDTLSFPRLNVRLLPNTSKLYSKARWCLELHSSLPKGKPAALFKGEVGFRDAYIKEPISQYSFLNHPKPYVLFHPDLPIYLDARRYGCDARFIRRSCRPNVTLSTMMVEDGSVHFGLFAMDNLKSGTELTVGWDWNAAKQVRHLAAENFDFSKLSAEELKSAAEWAYSIQENVGDCACGYGLECMLNKIKNVAGFEAPTKILSNGLGGRKQRKARNPSTEPNVSKEPTPDRNGTYEDDRSSASGVAKQKSRSRELTPAVAHDASVDVGSMTGREARKFKDVLSRIEKQEQEDNQNSKRRKRNSTVSIETKKSKSKQNSPVSTPRPMEVSVTDTSSGRRVSDSSEGSVKRRHQNGESSKSRRTVVNKATKYVDTSIQTDPEAEVPWWQSDQKPSPRPARPTLRQRLMQSLLSEQGAPSVNDTPEKKRKHDAVEDVEMETVSPKIPKVDESDVQHVSVSSKQIKNDTQATSVSISVTEVSTSSTAVSTAERTSPKATGPSLGNLFADTENTANTPATDASRPRSQSPSKASAAAEPDRSRSPGLHLQLPTPSQTSPASSVGSVTSPMPTPNPLLSPAVAASLGGVATPSPTKTKKLSLKDYGKRRHKAAEAADKKDDDKGVAKSEATTPLTFLNDSKKLAGILGGPPTDVLSPPADAPSLDTKMPTARYGDPMEGVR